MGLKIINKTEEPLLSRTRIESEIIFEKATPSREEIKSRLAKDLGKDGKLIVVKGIYTSYGLKKAKNLSYVYENEESLKRIEAEKKEKTSGKKKETKEEKPEDKGKASEESKPEEKPQEQKTEQKQPEK